MVIIFLGKRGSGKTAAMRKAAWIRHQRARPKQLIFFHDPGCQIAGGRVLAGESQVKSYFNGRRPSQIESPIILRNVSCDFSANLALAVKDCTLCLDEADLAANDKRWKSDAVKKIVHYGRHSRVSLFAGFRRVANVPEDLVSQSSYAFLFRQSESTPQDLRTMGHRFGQEYAEAVKGLKKLEFVIWEED